MIWRQNLFESRVFHVLDGVFSRKDTEYSRGRGRVDLYVLYLKGSMKE